MELNFNPRERESTQVTLHAVEWDFRHFVSARWLDIQFRLVCHTLLSPTHFWNFNHNTPEFSPYFNLHSLTLDVVLRQTTTFPINSDEHSSHTQLAGIVSDRNQIRKVNQNANISPLINFNLSWTSSRESQAHRQAAAHLPYSNITY